MRVICHVCDVESEIPDTATAHRCSNCGTQLAVKSDGTTRRPFEPMKIILPGLVLLLFVACYAVSTQ
jgi:DNA-directed RNA polymerase subunit RPC12/RpoP